MSATRLPETVTYWIPGVNDGFGGVTWAVGVVVESRTADVSEQVVNKEGVSIVANGAVYTNADIPNGAYISPTESLGAATPTSDAGEVVKESHTRSMSTLHRYLVRFP